MIIVLVILTLQLMSKLCKNIIKMIKSTPSKNLTFALLLYLCNDVSLTIEILETIFSFSLLHKMFQAAKNFLSNKNRLYYSNSN